MGNAIARVTAHNFSVFRSLDVTLAKGINVIAGENGTGKSHLLKLMYCVTSCVADGGEQLQRSQLQNDLASKLIGVYKPEALGRLVRRRQGRARAEVDVNFEGVKEPLKFSFATNSKSEVSIVAHPVNRLGGTPVYVPPRELLTIYPGFVSVYERTELEFEETWRDTCVLLGVPLARGPRQERVRALVEPLESVLGGSVVEDGGRFYLRVPNDGRFEMPLVAEGLRKLAMLARLIGNGSLFESGYLFWDEPEANLNPRVIRHVAKSIVSLAQSGVQVVVGTHSLFLLKELEIEASGYSSQPVPINFIGLRQTEDGVVADTANKLEDLESLSVLDEALAQSDRYLEMLSK